MYIKNFKDWLCRKEKIEKEKAVKRFRNGEIRWVSLGVNIGAEIDGKGESFNRPCVLVSFSSDSLALVFPMSSKIKNLPGYVKIKIKEEEVSVCIHQAKVISTKRIFERITTISEDKLTTLKEAYKNFYHL